MIPIVGLHWFTQVIAAALTLVCYWVAVGEGSIEAHNAYRCLPDYIIFCYLVFVIWFLLFGTCNVIIVYIYQINKNKNKERNLLIFHLLKTSIQNLHPLVYATDYLLVPRRRETMFV